MFIYYNYLLLFSNLWIYGIDDLLSLSVLAWATVNKFCSLRLWLWRGIFLGNRDLWFKPTRHFSQTIDRVFLDELLVFQGQTLQVQTHILYQVLPLDSFFCTRSSAQIWLTVSLGLILFKFLKLASLVVWSKIWIISVFRVQL